MQKLSNASKSLLFSNFKSLTQLSDLTLAKRAMNEDDFEFYLTIIEMVKDMLDYSPTILDQYAMEENLAREIRQKTEALKNLRIRSQNK